MRTLVVAAIAFGLSVVAKAQTETPVQKIGFADTEYILTQLPKFKQIDNELKTHGTQLENQLKAKIEDYQTKVKAAQALPATTPEAILADKQREIQALQENIQKFQQDAQSSIQKKQAELMDPLYKQIGKAIEEVAKENAYSFILQPQLANGGDVLLFSDEKFNISNLVLKKLGVTPTASTTTTPVKQN